MYNERAYVNKTHLSDSRSQQQKAEAGRQQLQQLQLLLVVGSTAYYHKLQQELWILHMSMSPKERERKKILLWVKWQTEKNPHLYYIKNAIKENKSLNMYEQRQKIQIQYKGHSFWTSSNKVKTILSSMLNFYNQKNHQYFKISIIFLKN